MISLSRSNEGVECFELGQGFDIELSKHFLIIEPRIVTAVTGNARYVGTLKLLQHRVHVIGGHFSAIIADNRTEVKEFAEFHAIGLVSSPLSMYFSGIGQYLESTVRSEVEHIAVFLPASVDSSIWRLNSENGLHISFGIGIMRARQHHYRSPRLYGNSCSEFAARESNRACLFGIIAHRLFYHIECVIVLFLIVSVTCDIHDFKLTKDRMSL